MPRNVLSRAAGPATSIAALVYVNGAGVKF